MEKMQAGEDVFCPFRHFYVLNKNRQKTKISFSFSPLTHRRGDSYYIFSKLEYRKYWVSLIFHLQGKIKTFL